MPETSHSELVRTLTRAGMSLLPAQAKAFESYDALLLKWQKAINLIGPTTVEDRFERHFLDSAQVFTALPDPSARIVDLGSGAGFPGLVLALLGATDVHLVESDIRKATFLREVSRETSAPVTIHDRRAEDCKIEGVGVITARALAPLVDLLAHMHRLTSGNENAVGFFLKGALADEELAKAQKRWVFSVETRPSLTDEQAKILKISALKPKNR